MNRNADNERPPLFYHQIMACRNLPLFTRGVLYGMYRHADVDGSNYFQGLPNLANELNIPLRTLKVHIKLLRDEGYIRETGRKDNNIVVYAICYQKLLEPMVERKKQIRTKKPQIELEIVENVPVTQPKYTLTREEIHAKLEAALAKKERAQHP